MLAKDNDLKIISKIFEFFAEGHEIERSRHFRRLIMQMTGNFVMYQLRICPMKARHGVMGRWR
jgi:hypothetical protein